MGFSFCGRSIILGGATETLVSSTKALLEATETLVSSTKASDGATETLVSSTKASDGATETLVSSTKASDGATETLDFPTKASDGATETLDFPIKALGGATETLDFQTTTLVFFHLPENNKKYPVNRRFVGFRLHFVIAWFLGKTIEFEKFLFIQVVTFDSDASHKLSKNIIYVYNVIRLTARLALSYCHG